MNEVAGKKPIQPLTISQLTRRITAHLERGFASVWVTGEVSNLFRAESGHLYFTLKDNNCQLRTVLFRSVALRMKHDVKDGMEVIARGRISVFQPRGDYQLNIEEIQPKGIGPLELALRQLREKLSVRGWFEPQRKKPLPRFPRRIALVTSPGGAAVRDMLEILARRWLDVEVWICPVAVQGDGAARQIATMIRRLNRMQPAVDVIITGRGGGSLEDLWAFNEEIVAEAIYRSDIPVVSAVGHEIDLTIADLVADRRALTPSEAAELVVPDRTKVAEQLDNTALRLKDILCSRLNEARQRCIDLAQARAFRMPVERVRELERRVDDWADRLQRATRQQILNGRQRAQALSAQMDGLSPLNVLSRGYSLSRTEKGKVIRGASQVQPGDRIETLLAKGRILSRVEIAEDAQLDM